MLHIQWKTLQANLLHESKYVCIYLCVKSKTGKNMCVSHDNMEICCLYIYTNAVILSGHNRFLVQVLSLHFNTMQITI